MMDWVRNIDTFYNFIGLVVVSAPDRFPIEDYREPDDQLTLERAFVELRRGLEMVDPEVATAEKMPKMSQLLDESLQAYRAGNDVKGAHLLQDFEAMIFKEA
jgi:hypothetical protein